MSNLKHVVMLKETLTELLHKIHQSTKEDQATLFQKLKSIMNSTEMKEMFSVFLELEPLDTEELELLHVILEACNTIYNYSGDNTGITDSEYDSLVEYYKDLSGKEFSITEPLIAGDTSSVVHHRYKTLRGTLDKIYKITDADVLKNKSQKSLDDWIKTSLNRCFESTGYKIDLMDCDVMVMPKFDGVSCIFECNKDGSLKRALTRGDTARNEAQDITHIFKDTFVGPFTNADYEYGLKTEIMMLDDDLEKFNEEFHKDYKNTRSIVSSILNSEEKDVRAEYLQIIPLRYSYLINGEESRQYLAPGIFNYPYINCKLKDVDKIHEYAFAHKTVYPGLRCDGAVIYIKDENVQKALGRENEKQKFEVAFKFTEETAYSKVQGVEFTTGLFGRVTPVVWFKPIKMKGNTIENASLGSYRRFKDMNLAVGDKIKVLYDIIPYVIYDETDAHCKRSENNPIEAPTMCPDCYQPLTESESGDMLMCTNKECPCRERGKILNFTKKMNIANISYATIYDFYKKGYLRKIEDLYTLKDHFKELIQLPGYGELTIQNILREIYTHTEVTPSVLMGSIGIEGLSIKSFKKIFEYITLPELMDIALSGNSRFFTVIPGIKDKTALKLVNGIIENEWTINYLRNTLTVLEEPNTTSGDFSVVFTKVRSEEAEKFISEAGGIVGENVTKDTTLVIIPEEGVTSGKTKLAMKYNIPIITINDMKEYITDKILKSNVL